MVLPFKTWCIVDGGILVIVLTVLPMMFPKRQLLIPSPASVDRISLYASDETYHHHLSNRCHFLDRTNHRWC